MNLIGTKSMKLNCRNGQLSKPFRVLRKLNILVICLFICLFMYLFIYLFIIYYHFGLKEMPKYDKTQKILQEKLSN